MSRYLRFIRRGEYDLANIMNVGVDPITGATFDACWEQWDAARVELLERVNATRWWQVWRILGNRWRAAAWASWRGY